MKIKMSTIGMIVLMIIAVFLAACDRPYVPPSDRQGTFTEFSFGEEKEVNTKQFKSIDEYNEFVKKYEQDGYYGGVFMKANMQMMDAERSPGPS